MKESYITIIKGAKQYSKTFLIMQLITLLLKSGIHPKTIFYFLLHDPELANFIGEHPSEFGKYLRNEVNCRGKLFVFLDEFQKVKTITNIV